VRTLYLRNVPDDVAARLEEVAASEGLSLNAFAVRELTEAARRSYNARLFEGLSTASLDRDALVAGIRATRDLEPRAGRAGDRR
jgi:plasmid stability protein